MHSPSYYPLFLPLPVEDRPSAQSTLEGVIAQVATLATSLVLLVLQLVPNGAAGGLLVSVAFASLVWCVVATVVSFKYRVELQDTLAARRIEADSLPIADTTTLDLIFQGTQSLVPQTVLRSLEILEQLDAPNLEQAALRALWHADARVVAASARLLSKTTCRACIPVVVARLQTNVGVEAKVELLRACGRCAKGDSVKILKKAGLLDTLLTSGARLKSEVAVLFLRFGGRRSRSMGRVIAVSMAGHDEPSIRCLGALVLGSVGNESWSAAWLSRLLEDAEMSVARSAVIA
ncbi:MAG: hypothetical protein AAFV29_27600, partial [Myxococcota bacterium]